jgi:hypothetical protein
MPDGEVLRGLLGYVDLQQLNLKQPSDAPMEELGATLVFFAQRMEEKSALKEQQT